ncbi:sugar phosphate isomerase/epimerase family protein [Xylanivirga thermophila]|uniref:sugar phosphate isomerase/epimerase family protein n=1 Tax=Xylanivirga thermophila TaxID=2496273 RepID=UPI00101D9A25|nr:sugar phosphate isomerase/epimerase family protein [Xylanivirga thermophila]
MKTAVSMWSVQRQFFKGNITIDDFLSFAFRAGVDGVELLDCFWKNPAEIDNTIDLIDKNNWTVACYSISNDFVTEDEKELDEQIAYVKEGIDTAVRLGTDTLRVFAGNKKMDISYEEGIKYILYGLRECVSYAEQRGIDMVLENHGVFAGKSNQILAIINEVGSQRLKANVDIGNFLLVAEDPMDGIKHLRSSIGYVHLKDFKRLHDEGIQEVYRSLDDHMYQAIPIGQGDVPIKKTIEFLKSNDYYGYLSIEYEGIGDPIEETKQSIDFVKSII